RKYDLPGIKMKPQRLAADLQRQTIAQNLRLACEIGLNGDVLGIDRDPVFLNFLESRNFGHIDDVSELDRVFTDTNGRIMADAEISQRVSRRSVDAENRQNGEPDNGDLAHVHRFILLGLASR